MEGITFDDDQIMPANPQPSNSHHGNIEADVSGFIFFQKYKEPMLMLFIGQHRLGFGLSRLVSFCLLFFSNRAFLTRRRIGDESYTSSISDSVRNYKCVA